MPDANYNRDADRFQQPKDELLTEMIRVGDVECELYEDRVVITEPHGDVIIHPRTQREAHQQSRALRKCSIRLTAIAERLPREPETK